MNEKCVKEKKMETEEGKYEKNRRKNMIKKYDKKMKKLW